MRRLLIAGFASLFTLCCHLTAQTFPSGDRWMEYLEDLSEDLEDEDQMETIYADLSYLTEHPLDLNTADAETFRRLPFLSDAQIDAMLAYRKRYGPMATVYELKNIEALDWPTIELLLPFVYAGEIDTRRPLTFRNVLKYSSNELVVRYDPALQEKQGYRPQPDSILQQYPNRKYLGEPFYHSIRYSCTFDERLQAGLVAEKDAGEPFGKRIHRGYDYYSAHVLLRNAGWLKTLAVGDYKVSFGQGLIISHDFMPGRNAFLTQAERRTNGFRRHYSTNETDFFRGIASTVRWKDWDLSLFYSSRRLDATVDGTRITSFKTDGLHRVENDREKMRTAGVRTGGGNLRYATPQVVIGLTVVTYTYGNLSVEPEPAPYNRFYFRGTQNANAGVDYQFKVRQLKLFGETAVSKNGAWATLNALQWTPAPYVSGLILYRSYARDYQAFYGYAFAQNSRIVQNEQGVYLGMQLTPAAHWKLSGYADFFRFPWLKYSVDAPSSGVEYMAQADYAQGNRWSMYLRYRYRQKELNYTPADRPETQVLPYGQHRFRWQMTSAPTEELLLRTAADASFYSAEGRKSRGWMLSGRTEWKPSRIPLQADLFLAYFHTDDYYSRLSSYEKKLLYVYNTPFLYGKGTRVSAVCRYFLRKRLSLSAKTGWTHYFDGESVGSGLETVEGRNRIETSLMMQWKF